MIYDKVKKLATQKKVTIAEVERELGMSNGVISKWKDAIPNSVNLYKVAQYFGVTTEELLREDNAKEVK